MRIWAQGFDSDVAAENNGSGGSHLGQRPTAMSSRVHPYGHGFGHNIRRNQGAAVATRPANMATNPRTAYQRFYLRVLRTPTTAIASNKVWQQVSAAASAETAGMYLTTAGTFALYHGNSATGTLLGSFSYVTNRWYRVEIRITYDNDPTAASTGFLEWRVDGATIFSGQPSGSFVGSVNTVTLMASSQLGAFTSTHDFEADFDDWVGDTAAYPNDSVVRAALITGPGTYNNFGGTNGSPHWINQRTLQNDTTAATPAVATSSTNGHIQSYAIDLTQIPNIGTIRAFNIVVAATGTGVTWDVLLRVNGVDNYVRLGTSVPAFPGGSDTVDISLFPFTASDTLEIGIRRASGGATALTLRAIWLVVEHEGVEDPADYGADETVRTAIGSYTGTGLPQTIALGFLPDMLLIWGASQFAVNSFWWSDVLGPYGTLGTTLQGLERHAAASLNAAGDLLLVGGTTGINNSGTLYSYIALRDRPQRMFARAAWSSGPGSSDDVGVPLNAPSFLADAAAGLRATNSANAMRIRGAGYSGDLSSQLTTAATAAADGIQAISAGTIEIGSTLASPSGARVSVMGLRQSAFEQTTLFETLTWVGNASNPRNIPCARITGSIAAVIVTPHSTASRAMRSTGQSSSATEGTTSATAITSLGIGQFTVSSGLNANGVTYTAYVFATGEDTPLPTGYDDYWVVGYDGHGHFPPERTLVMAPTVGTNLSRGRSVAALAGTTAHASYPLINATDDRGDSVAKINETAGTIYVDLGSPQTPEGIAIFNHVFDDGLVVGIRGSNSATLSNPVVTVGVAARQPAMWADLRGFTFVPARYWGIDLPLDTPNSRPLRYGEIVVATFGEYEGIIDPGALAEEALFFKTRDLSEHGVASESIAGAMHRTLVLTLSLFLDEHVQLDAAIQDAGLTGAKLLVIPSSRLNNAYLMEGPARFEATSQQRRRTLRLTLAEESMGV